MKTAIFSNEVKCFNNLYIWLYRYTLSYLVVFHFQLQVSFFMYQEKKLSCKRKRIQLYTKLLIQGEPALAPALKTHRIIARDEEKKNIN